jgi:HEAT repeat protein
MPDDLGELFGGAVVPEATPSPRTIRFATPPLGDGPSRAFDADTAGADGRVAAVFAASDDVTNVLVGPTFVAVTIRRPERWEAVLAPLLRAVADGFAGGSLLDEAGDDGGTDASGPVASTPGPGEHEAHAPRRLERAWSELGPDDVGPERIVAAASDADPARRQVAAVRLADVAPDAARGEWTRLIDDGSRAVRRSVVDTIADATREDLRALLERALADTDPWIRWRALRGLAQLGPTPSRDAVQQLASDPDFRVRLEAARVAAGRV